MWRPHRRGLAPLGAAATVVGALLTLSSCSQENGQGLAQQACAHVLRSVSAYERSLRGGTSAATNTSLQRQAESELRAALPLAAAATSADGTWNSLMTTISESATVDESHLVPALRAQCVVAGTQLNVNPNPSPGS
ncbi:MAG TPA: hypothetical protein VND70_09000 [Acidimicrobiales bacterium]|nr:hypothetical protein [Acidimicrobiales bacterium]